MGKKKSGGSHGGEGEGNKKASSRAFVLKVDMHCECHGCIDKIRAAVKDITLLQGIESWDQSALESKGELKLVATADPEKLRERLHKATRKNVEVLFPKDKNASNKEGTDAATSAAAQALLLNSLMQQQHGQQNAWANQMPPRAGGGWNAHGHGYGVAQPSYPWAVQQQQQPDPYAAYSAGGAYPAAGGASWGAYPYPPAPQGHGGAWHGPGY